MRASLLAKALGQPTEMLNGPELSRAGSLPQVVQGISVSSNQLFHLVGSAEYALRSQHKRYS
ncbi:hypothetical protein PspCFBP13508_07985 [Pseudomonas sp. CFBP13508]|nr:hypothetical protein PspCFBP13508_07985 [Pseudomonas sp. CFBP13508]